MTRRTSFALALALALATPVKAGQVFADTYSGMAAGAALAGRTASDGTSTWASSGASILADGAGCIYSPTATSSNELLISNVSPPTSNLTATWTFVPASGGALNSTTQFFGPCFKVTASSDTRIEVLNQIYGGQSIIVLQEVTAVGGYTNAVNIDISAATTTINCSLTISAGTATLVCTGGVSGTLTLPLSCNAATVGNPGLKSYGTATATTGWHMGPLTINATTTPATSYVIRPGLIFAEGGNGPAGQASLTPMAWYLPSDTCGFSSAGHQGNGTQSICLDGVAPAGGFTWTVASGKLIDTSGNIGTSVTIPAGSDAASFAWVPPAGSTSNLTLSGANNAGLPDPAGLAITIAPKLALFEGDSISDQSYGAGWVSPVMSAMGSGWLCKSIAKSSSSLDDGSAYPEYNITKRGPITWGTCHDGARTQEALIVWGGTNDIAGGATDAQAFSRLQGIVNAAKGYGWRNIAVVTCISRNWSNAATMETYRTNFNASIRSAYGSSGTDKSVAVIDIGADANLGQANSWSNTTYFNSDGIHPFTSASNTLISGTYITPWLQSLPATQAVLRGRLRVVPPVRGRTLSRALPDAPRPPVDPETFVPSPLSRKAA